MAVEIWSRLPPEISLQIANHNADDLSALRAMSLTSRSMRDVAIEPLLSHLHFSYTEDFPRWLEMLQKAPYLVTAVRKVKISVPLDEYPGISPMPNVEEVEWSGNGIWDIRLAAMYMTQVFPNARRLSLLHIEFNHLAELSSLIRACSTLSSLTICGSSVSSTSAAKDNSKFGAVPVDLSGLSELALIANGSDFDSNGDNSLSRLMLKSPPTQLRVLKLVSSTLLGEVSDPCSIMTKTLLLRTAASSLTHLTIDPHLRSRYQTPLLYSAISGLPPLSELLELTLHFPRLDGDSYHAETFFAVLSPLPKLVILRFVIRVGRCAPDYAEYDYKWFHTLFAFRTAQYTAAALNERFPLLEAVEFVLCVAPQRHTVTRPKLTREYRIEMEDRLMSRLRGIGIGMGKVRVEWQDAEYRAWRWD
ncbi:hypothetical protein C8F01DRAFT_1163696, partial [Mycena amicta]